LYRRATAQVQRKKGWHFAWGSVEVFFGVVKGEKWWVKHDETIQNGEFYMI
jgi:hypothetical protein